MASVEKVNRLECSTGGKKRRWSRCLGDCRQALIRHLAGRAPRCSAVGGGSRFGRSSEGAAVRRGRPLCPVCCRWPVTRQSSQPPTATRAANKPGDTATSNGGDTPNLGVSSHTRTLQVRPWGEYHWLTSVGWAVIGKGYWPTPLSGVWSSRCRHRRSLRRVVEGRSWSQGSHNKVPYIRHYRDPAKRRSMLGWLRKL